MSEGSGGEPEREQDPWSQPTDSASAEPPAGQPEVGDYASAGPDSWSTTWANPDSPTRPTLSPQPDSSDQQLPPAPNGFSAVGEDSATAPADGHQPPAGQYPAPGGQYGYQRAPGQYPSAAGQVPSLSGQYGYQPAPGQDPQAASQYGYQPPPGQYAQTPGQYPQALGQYGYQPSPGQYPASAGQYGPQQWPAYPAAPRNNRVAIAALVCGVAQFVLGLLIVGNIVLAIPAIICGAIGLKQTRQRGESGRGMAIAGLVLGILGVVYFAIIVVVLVILSSIHHHSG
jgi:Domain of unknown function (DUF4190)